MRLLVCGSRTWSNKERIFKVLDELIPKVKYEETEILEGACPTGADHFARDYARDNELTFINVPARWNTLGNKAGPIRNERMARDYKPDVVIGFSNDIKNSKGTRSMLLFGLKYKITTILVTDNQVINVQSENNLQKL